MKLISFIKSRSALLALSGAVLLVSSGNVWAYEQYRRYSEPRSSVSIRYSTDDACYPDRQYYRHGSERHDRYDGRRYDAYRPKSLTGDSYDTLVVNIPNDNGSYTPVTLRRAGNVYVGPRGEQYLAVPTVEQLKAIYGLK